MRGTNSMAKAVALAPLNASTVALSRQASSRLTTTARGFRALISDAVGPRTFRSMSAPANTADRSALTLAPASA